MQQRQIVLTLTICRGKSFWNHQAVIAKLFGVWYHKREHYVSSIIIRYLVMINLKTTGTLKKSVQINKF